MRPPWRANELEAPPDSGVRTSAEAPARDLTYSVYTLDDLEARAHATRTSMPATPPFAPRSARWHDVGASGLVLARTCARWVRAPKPRAPVMDVCRVPLTAFGTDLKVALASLPWKTIAAGAGAAVGSVVLLLLIVLTTAELTDDVKPRRGSAARTSMVADDARAELPGTTAGAIGEQMAAAQPPLAPGAVAPAASPVESMEIDDAPVRPKAKPAAARPAKKKKAKKKPVEVFNP